MTARTLHGTSMNRFLVLNPPDSPPAVYNPHDVILNSCGNQVRLEVFEERCRNCQSTELFIDSAQGDRVCHQCGHVLEGHVMVDPQQLEWKETAITTNDMSDDHCKQVHSSMARADLSMEDDTPSTDGRQQATVAGDKISGGTTSQCRSKARIRKRLKSTHTKLHRLRRRQRSPQQILASAEDSQREQYRDANNHENADQQQSTVHEDKWSLQRAILIHGTPKEQTEENILLEDRQELLDGMDDSVKQAAQDLYMAYYVTKKAAKELALPDRVMEEAMDALVSYAKRRDGFMVKGVYSKLSKTQHYGTIEDREAMEERLKKYNTLKQISSLCAAALHLAAKKLGSTKMVTEVCGCFYPQSEWNANEKAFLKPKHFSRAMVEVKSTLPEYAADPVGGLPNNLRAASSDFSDKFVERLRLPPVAEASIHLLFTKFWKEHTENDPIRSCDAEMATICAAVTYFVCCMGARMQNLAKQLHETKSSRVKKRTPVEELQGPSPAWKKQKLGAPSDYVTDEGSESGDERAIYLAKVFGNHSEKEAYEMRRMWDAWSEQISWSRSPADIEQSCGVSRHALLDCYRTKLFPRLETFLSTLKDSVCKTKSSEEVVGALYAAPLAPILLGHVTFVAPVMKDD